MLEYESPSPVSALALGALKKYDGKTLYLEDNGIVFPVRVKLNQGSDRLFVMLNGAVDRQKERLPKFARWNWGKMLRGHVIAVCDPTLYLDERLRLGWFLGSAAASALPGLTKIAETAAAGLGIASGRTIFYGSSGGGFAAVAGAASMQDGRAIAINPQTDITAYFPGVIADLRDVLGGEAAFEDVCRDDRRIRLQAAIADARSAGRNGRFVFLQNTVDKFHHAHHYSVLAKSLPFPVEGGFSSQRDVLSMTYGSPEGHSAEPPEVVKTIVDTAFPYLLEGEAIGPRPDVRLR